jgi:beta-lactamase regulating signal transducer with metallopeptidase domain
VPFRWLTQAAPPGSAVANPAPIATWAVVVWLLGVAVLLLRRAGGWLSARRILARAVVAADDQWIARLDGLRRRMGIPRAVSLVESALAGTPAVIGWMRPVILAPAGWLMGLPAAQAEAILCMNSPISAAMITSSTCSKAWSRIFSSITRRVVGRPRDASRTRELLR